MRKRIINHGSQDILPPDRQWLNLEALADVEVTSEDTGAPDRVGIDTGGRIGLAGGTTWTADRPSVISRATEDQTDEFSLSGE